MRILKTSIIAGLLTLVSTSAFAGSDTLTAAPQANAAITQSHAVKAPVLIDAGYYAPKTVKRRVTRVVVEPVEALVARQASTSDHGAFFYKYTKRTNTKTYRPAASTSQAMPNLFN